MTNGHFSNCFTPQNCWCEIKRYGAIFGIAIIILIVEVKGGMISQSLALLADAGHVFIDTIAILVSIIVGYLVKRGAGEEIRKMGGYINAFLLGGVTIWIAIEAIERFQNPREVLGLTMFFYALAGTLGNYFQHRIIDAAKETHVTHESMQLHILSDLVQSVGVVLGGILIWMTGWLLIDPIISMVIALMMARWTWKLLTKLWSGKYDDNHHCHH